MLKNTTSVATKALGVLGALSGVVDVIISWTQKNPNREQGEKVKAKLELNIEELKKVREGLQSQF